MAETVAEIMDSAVFHASAKDSIGRLLHEITVRGATADVARARHSTPASERQPVGSEPRCAEQASVSVHHNTRVDAAARLLAEHNADCLILVNDAGVAVGALSALDLLQALFGVDKTKANPAAPQARNGAWSRAAALDAEAVQKIPPAPGIILIDHVPRAGQRPSVVWAEACENIRGRLEEILHPEDSAAASHPELQAVLECHPRRFEFRVLIVVEPERRARLLRALREVLSHVHPEPDPVRAAG
jgi:CBS domain-containing protein